jgi:hypothetical protein
MLEPQPKKRNRVADVLVLLVLTAIAVGLAWFCSQSDKMMKPDESDCIEQLREQTRRQTNFNEDEVVSYGRCLMDRRR